MDTKQLKAYFERIVRNDGPQTHVAGFHFPISITRKMYNDAIVDLPYDRSIYSYVAHTDYGATPLFFSIGPNDRIAHAEYQNAVNLILPIIIGAEHSLDKGFIAITNEVFDGAVTYEPRVLHDAADCKWLNRVFEGHRTFAVDEAYTDYDAITGTIN